MREFLVFRSGETDFWPKDEIIQKGFFRLRLILKDEHDLITNVYQREYNNECKLEDAKKNMLSWALGE